MLPKMLLKPKIGYALTRLFSPKSLILLGERGGTRTHDLLIKSQLLYRLSYALSIFIAAHDSIRNRVTMIMRQRAICAKSDADQALHKGAV
jgi:hypothetical protein